MSTPDFSPQPSTAFSDDDVVSNVHGDIASHVQASDIGNVTFEATGPDHTASVPLDEIPKVNRRNPPRSAGLNGKEKPTGLGLNRTAGSGIPKLNKTHQEQIASMYTYAGMGVSAVNMRLAKAIATGADDCAASWIEWGNANDKLRRRILAMLEGGAATKVFMAHMPILIAAVPPEFISNMLARFGMAPASEEDTDA